MSAGLKRAVSGLLVAAASAVFLAFAIANRETVQVSFFPLPYMAVMPLFLFAILCFTLGAMIGWCVIRLKFSKVKRLLKGEHKRVMALQNEVQGLQKEKQEAPPALLRKM